jgi:hypothetical protein
MTGSTASGTRRDQRRHTTGAARVGIDEDRAVGGPAVPPVGNGLAAAFVGWGRDGGSS